MCENLTPNELCDKILSECEEQYYWPSESVEYYNHETNTWYNHSGQKLRNPDEYNSNQEGFSPFGDE